MTRVAIAFALVAVVAVGALALAGEPGRASLEWMGWRVEMTAAAAALLTLFSALMFTLLWRGIIWIVEAPRRAARVRAEAKRKQAIEALSRGFLAAAAGDGSEAPPARDDGVAGAARDSASRRMASMSTPLRVRPAGAGAASAGRGFGMLGLAEGDAASAVFIFSRILRRFS